MKSTFFSKSILFVCFALLGLNAQAKTIYLSASGNNTQSGLDESNAVATLGKAVSLCSSGDEISVSGMIDLSKESYDADGLRLPGLNLKITGKEVATSGFSGSAAAIWFSGNTSITNCTFSNNQSTTGILCFADVDLTLTRCIFKDNAGTPLYITNTETAEAIKNTLRIEACLFASNVAGEGDGGALFLDNYQEGKTVQLTIVNSTFYNNQADSNGGAILFSSLQAGSSVDLINNTIVGNKVTIAVAGGAGLYFHSDAQFGIKRIYNCIIESNMAADSTGRIPNCWH
ncbi:hypothetical protein AGMMS50262_19150 [Bacteroidia bacterium]|nr:hypothetical protein AGMMS50262_19150 [Bacteroidia bacterium]